MYLDTCISLVHSLQPYLEPTVIIPSSVNNHLVRVSSAINVDPGIIAMTLGILLTCPLGLLMNALPFGKLRHLFSFLSGLFLLQFVVGVEWIHTLITSVVAYAIIVVLPTRFIIRIIPAFLLLYMMAAHIHRQRINYLGFDMDFTTLQMIITQKLYGFAYNIYDGEMIAKGRAGKASKKCSKFALNGLPSFFEYLGYTFCFSSVLVGPSFEFKLYQDACDGLNISKDGILRKNIPSNFWPSMGPFLVGVVCLISHIVGSTSFPILSDSNTGTPVIISEEFLSFSWYYQFSYIWLAISFNYHSMIGVWKISECANNLWYLGFEGYDENGIAMGWEIANNVDVCAFELPSSPQELMTCWNKKTGLWLRKYIYYRTSGSLFITYLINAVWHGFYPAYYLVFGFAPFITQCERLCRKNIGPHLSKLGVFYRILTTFITGTLRAYFLAGFCLLSFDRAMFFWRSHYYFVHVSVLLLYGIMLLFPSPKRKVA